MRFFNKKEEVLDLQLTQYGKHLLSLGKLKPAYYSFFDNNIIYDSQYGAGPELPKDAESRIQDDTPYLRTQHVFSGIETEIRAIAEENQADYLAGKVIKTQPSPERHYALSAPIGNMTMTTSSAPAWNISFMKSELSSSIEYMTGSHATVKVPQLEVEVKYNVHTQEEGNNLLTEGLALDDPSIKYSVSNRFSDGTFFLVLEDELLIDVFEENTDFEEENVEIEIYEIEEKDYGGKISTPGLETTTVVENLNPLYFIKRPEPIKDDILLDTVPATALTAPDATYADYFFDIRVDHQIPENDICKGIQKLKNKGTDARPDYNIECPDELKKVPFDLYASNVTDEDIEECSE